MDRRYGRGFKVTPSTEIAEKIIQMIAAHTCFNLPKHTPELIKKLMQSTAYEIDRCVAASFHAGKDSWFLYTDSLKKEAFAEGFIAGQEEMRGKAASLLQNNKQPEFSLLIRSLPIKKI